MQFWLRQACCSSSWDTVATLDIPYSSTAQGVILHLLAWCLPLPSWCIFLQLHGICYNPEGSLWWLCWCISSLGQNILSSCPDCWGDIFNFYRFCSRLQLSKMVFWVYGFITQLSEIILLLITAGWHWWAFKTFRSLQTIVCLLP